MLILGAAALLFFGPDQLPKVARQAGRVVRDVQSTSQSFIREMERAADDHDERELARADRMREAAAREARPEDATDAAHAREPNVSPEP